MSGLPSDVSKGSDARSEEPSSHSMVNHLRIREYDSDRFRTRTSFTGCRQRPRCDVDVERLLFACPIHQGTTERCDWLSSREKGQVTIIHGLCPQCSGQTSSQLGKDQTQVFSANVSLGDILEPSQDLLSSPINPDELSSALDQARHLSKKCQDAPSIFSIRSYSTAGTEYSNEDIDLARMTLIDFFSTNETLRPCFVKAFKNSNSVERNENNFRRLLKSFSTTVSNEATTTLQQNLIKLIRRRSREISSSIRKRFSSNAELNLGEGAVHASDTEGEVSDSELTVPGTCLSSAGSVLEFELTNFLLSSEAFQRLCDDYQKFLFPSETIMRKQIQAVLENAKDLNGKIFWRIEADWQVLQYYEEEVLDQTRPFDILTLTGSPEKAQAVNAENYVRDVWKSNGVKLFDYFIQGLRSGFCSVSLSETHYLEINFFKGNLERLTQEKASIALTGTFEEVLATLDQLAWFAATFRPSNIDGIVSSYVNFEPKDVLASREDSEYPYQSDGFVCSYRLSLSPLKREVLDIDNLAGLGSNACWFHLFPKGILARLFPVADRSGGEGLELPYELMLLLSQVSVSMEHDNGVILVGPSLSLFPSKTLDGAVQWHCFGDKNPKKIIEAINKCSDRVRTTEISGMAKLRTFLGAYQSAAVFAGTKHLLSSSIVGDSGVDASKSRLELAREGTTSLGFSTVGVTGGVVAKWLLPKTLKASLETQREHDDRTENASKRPIMVYDYATKTGWLVPELCMVLHLAHVFLKQRRVQQRGRIEFNKQNSEQQTRCENTSKPTWPEIPFSYPASDGGQAALETVRKNGALPLYKKQEDGKPKEFWSVIDDFLLDLCSIRRATNLRKFTAGWQPISSRLQGWDFNELATKVECIPQRELPTTSNRSQWWQIADEQDILVLLGQNFGDLMMPDINSALSGWETTPANAELLVASMPCIQHLVRKQKQVDGHYRLTSKLFWHKPQNRSGHCNKHCNRHCIIIQELKAENLLMDILIRSDPNPPDERIRKGAAVVFGEAKFYHDSLSPKVKAKVDHLSQKLVSSNPMTRWNTILQ